MASSGESLQDDRWRVAIQDPQVVDGHDGILGPHGESVATSRDYVQHLTDDMQ